MLHCVLLQKAYATTIELASLLARAKHNERLYAATQFLFNTAKGYIAKVKRKGLRQMLPQHPYLESDNYNRTVMISSSTSQHVIAALTLFCE